MKQIVKKMWTLLCGVGLLAFASCSNSNDEPDPDDWIWDYSPLVLKLKVLSPEGYSILPYTTLTKISATYRGQQYYLGVDFQETRTYLPHFYGLLLENNDYLIFGELDGAGKYEDEQVVINWGDDSIKPDTITFSHWIISEGKVHNSFSLNGKTMEQELTVRKDLPTGMSRREVKPIALTDHQKACINPVNQFGLNLLKKMDFNDTESSIASPLGVAYVLAMIAGGAPEGSRTAEEIQQALSGILQDGNTSDNSAMYYLMKREEIDDLFRTIIEQSPTTDPGVDLTVADAFFVRNGFPIYPDYVDYLASYYQADYDQLDFNSPKAVDIINGWCNQKTHGLIPSIIKEIKPEQMAFLINAIYFRAPWTQEFSKEATKGEAFTKADGTQTTLPMMHLVEHFPYAETADYQAVRMPFANGAYAMTFVLPKAGVSVSQLLVQQNIYEFHCLQDSLAKPKDYVYSVDVALPRFEASSDHNDLIKQLAALGVERVFTDQAELTKISSQPLFVSAMKQKARIKVNEEGCEAAAVTVATFETTCAGGDPEVIKTFRADHPFLYFITEQSTGLIFFAGTYCGD